MTALISQNFVLILVWSDHHTVSKAFFNSVKTPNVYFFLFSDVVIYSINSSNACEVDKIEARNPYWLFEKIFKINSSNLLLISVIFRHNNYRYIGY